MFGVFKKKEKLPLIVRGKYSGSYKKLKDDILSAELSFDDDGARLLFDKGVKKEIVSKFNWSDIEGFDFRSSKDGKSVIFDIVLYLKDGIIALKENIDESNVQYAIVSTLEPHYKKVKKFVLEKLTSDSDK